MMYNPYFPATYQNSYMAQQNPYITQPNPQMQQAQNNGSFIRVPNELSAREYPVAPGNSITFIDESAPYCYTKTAGNSPLEAPIFKRYKLVEEEQPQNTQNESAINNTNIDLSEYVLKSDLTAVLNDYEAIKNDAESLKTYVGNLKSKIDTLKSEIDTLKTEISRPKRSEIGSLNIEYDGVD